MGVIGLAGILATPSLVPALFPQKMFAMLDNFSLLALPYFILAGELISAGGISKRLVQFAETVVGHWRGGLGHASVVSSMVFAGVSGSSVADTSAIGSEQYDFQTVVSHELGHSLGLEHQACDNQHNIMANRCWGPAHLSTLTPDQIARARRQATRGAPINYDLP